MKEYLELQRQYRSALVKSQAEIQATDQNSREKAITDRSTAFRDKAKIMGEIRQMERESARAGKVLNPVNRKGAIDVEVTDTSTRRSLQEEYVRKFDPKVKVKIENRDGSEYVGTLRDYHAKRLLAK